MSSGGVRETDYFGGGSGGQGMTDFPTGGSGPGPLDTIYSSTAGSGTGSSGYQQYGTGDPSQSPHQRGQGGQQRYRFTPEELRVLRECNRESFYYRSLPIGTVLGCSAYYGVRHGYLKPSARFGAGPKMFVASIIGYFIGKMSYQRKCAEKLMALPNSHIGEMLRQRKGQMGFQEVLTMEPSFSTTAPVGGPAFPNSDFNRPNVYSDVGDTRPMSSLDSDASNTFSSYDYSQPSNYDTTQQMLDDENLPPKRPQFSTTYDDLRRQNRIDYESRQHRNISSPAAPPPDPMQQGSQGTGFDRRTPVYPEGQAKPRNKYGDVWDEKPSNY